MHITDIVAKAHKRCAVIHRAFICRNVDLLKMRAYVLYFRPLVEHDGVVWAQTVVKDIEALGSVQRRFTKPADVDFNSLRSFTVTCIVKQFYFSDF